LYSAGYLRMSAVRWCDLEDFGVCNLFLFVEVKGEFDKLPKDLSRQVSSRLPCSNRQYAFSFRWGFLFRRSDSHTCCWQLWFPCNIVIHCPKCLQLFEHRLLASFHKIMYFCTNFISLTMKGADSGGRAVLTREVSSCLTAGIAGSDPAEDMDIHILLLLHGVKLTASARGWLKSSHLTIWQKRLFSLFFGTLS